MCQFFSCIVDKDKTVYWERGVDHHSGLVKKFNLKEPDLPEPPTNEQLAQTITWAKVEIVPKNSYLDGPSKKHWKFEVDEPIKPVWWSKSYEKPCWEAWKEAIKIYDEFNLKEVKNPVHPFKIKAPKNINKRHINLLKQWDSVRDSVRGSVWDSVWGSVRDSVWDSVRAYTGSLFPSITNWKHVDRRRKPFNRMKKTDYPFQSGEKLWRMGLVPVRHGGEWHLYGSPKGNGKAEKLYTLEDK